MRFFGFLSVLCLLLTGCGTEKESDPASEQVLRISITPAAVFVQEPEKVNPAAITTNGSLTMTNDYLLENSLYENYNVRPQAILSADGDLLDAEAGSEADIYGEGEEGSYEE